jgi:Concanavalin A-like lectin/glucanases superfamily
VTIAAVANAIAYSSDHATVTTSGIDTTGANLVVVCIWWYGGSPSSLADSKSNTWIPLTPQVSGGVYNVQLYYCAGGTVGAGHTFTGTAAYSAMAVEAFSGAAASPFLGETGTETGSNVTSLHPGSITPGANGALLVAGADIGPTGTLTIDSGFTAAVLDTSFANYEGGGIAYLIQGASAAVNPTWSWPTPEPAAAVMAAFAPNLTTYENAVLTDGPSVYYRLTDPVSSATVADSSGHGYTATGNSTYTLGTTGILPGSTDTSCLLGGGYFNGWGGSLVDPATGDFAIEWWQKSTDASSYDVLFYSGTFAGMKSGKVVLNTGSEYVSSASVNSGSLFHCVITRESGALKFYINGTLDTNFGAIGDNVYYRSGTTLGAYSTSFPFLGTVQEFALYNAALSSARVTAHYSAGSSSGATSYTFTGPSTAHVGVASTNFTVTPNASYSGTITPSDAGAGGTFTPSSLSWTTSSTPKTFTYTPAVSGTPTISASGSPALTNSSGTISLTVTMTAITSNGTGGGTWATGSTWIGGVAPGAGQKAIIASGDTVTASATTTIGDGSANTCLDCSVGFLVVSGAVFTLRGNATFGTSSGGSINNRLVVQHSGGTGATFQFDGNAGVTPVATIGRDTNMVFTGTSSGRVTLTTKSGTAGNTGRFVSDLNGYLQCPFTMVYTDVSNLGDASTAGIPTYLYVSGGADSWMTATADNCTFSGNLNTPTIIVSNGAAVISFTNCTFTNNGGHLQDFSIDATVDITTGTRLIDHCIFMTEPGSWLPQGFTVTNCYFHELMSYLGTGPPWASATANFFRNSVVDGTGEVLGLPANISSSFMFYCPGVAATSYFSIQGAFGGTIDNNVLQYIAHDASSNLHFFGMSHSDPASTRTLTLTRNLLIPPQGTSGAFCGLVDPISDAGPSYSGVTNLYAINHNTICMYQSPAMQNDASFGSKAGAITSLKNNLVYNTGTPQANNQLFLFNANEPTFTTPTDVIAVSGGVSQADYNGWYGLTTATGNVGTVPLGSANGTVYFSPATAVPGTHDVASTNPNFVDATRSLQTWSVAQGYSLIGDSDTTKIANALTAIQAAPSLTGSSLIPYVRAGFAPTNATLFAAASDGTTIGAIQAGVSASASGSILLAGL